MDSNYTQIFNGNQFEAQSIVAKLKDIGITAVLKDETASARLAGFGSSDSSTQVYVHNDELEKAKKALNG